MLLWVGHHNHDSPEGEDPIGADSPQDQDWATGKQLHRKSALPLLSSMALSSPRSDSCLPIDNISNCLRPVLHTKLVVEPASLYRSVFW
jgi:hypothetical protein